ncbi:Bax inhibitor-1 family protein [Thalassoglobus sp.]|uniref:Bax inhibitor-1/YccA family protein n=1 Tax=Thalassoglobus sp. TaxID=2795869 RepID=UPI003AA8AC2E
MNSPADNYSMDYGQRDLFVADAAQEERVTFIRRTYAHVAGAVAFFVVLLAIILNTPSIVQPLTNLMLGNWWIVLIVFFIASTAAHRMAATGANPGLQYAGLAFYALAQAVIFAPFLYLIQRQMGGDVIMQSAIFTLMIFGGLTTFVLATKSDFSFMRNILVMGGFAAMALIVVSLFTSITLGTWFSGAMILLMSGFILWETSNVLHHYRTDQYVAASLAIFSSLATLFWYVLRFTAAFND